MLQTKLNCNLTIVHMKKLCKCASQSVKNNSSYFQLFTSYHCTSTFTTAVPLLNALTVCSYTVHTKHREKGHPRYVAVLSFPRLSRCAFAHKIRTLIIIKTRGRANPFLCSEMTNLISSIRNTVTGRPAIYTGNARNGFGHHSNEMWRDTDCSRENRQSPSTAV